MWKCESVLGKGSFGRVYKAVRHDGEHTYYSAVKHISVPADEQQLEDARRSGLYQSDAELSVYFGDMVRDVQSEIDLMYTLKANTNIVSYEDHLIIPKGDSIGCDIFIRMELLRDLSSLDMNSLTEKDAVKIGTDICTALEVCAYSNIIHRDIKPSNIFVNAKGDYKLGDFGIAKVLNGATAGVSKKGTYSYMAPEIYKCEPANFTSDIYSLGVVLYRILNNNRLPFLPLTGIVRAQDQEAAMLKMVGGAPMPAPVNASPQMAKVILKACAYNKRDRYKNATEFKNALIEAFTGVGSAPEKTRKLQHNTIIDFPPANEVSPTQINEDNRTQLNAEDRTQLNAEDKTQLKAKPAESKAKSKKKIGGIIGAVGAVAAIVTAILIFFSWKNSFVYVDGEKIDKNITELFIDSGEIENIKALKNYSNMEKIYISSEEAKESDLKVMESVCSPSEIYIVIGNESFPINSRTVELSGIEYDFNEVEKKIVLFNSLESIDLGDSGLSDEEIGILRSTNEKITVKWDVDLFGKIFKSSESIIDLSGNTDVSLDDLADKLKVFDNLEKVDLSDCGLKDEDMWKFEQETGIDIVWEITLGKKTFKTNVTALELRYNGISNISVLKYCTDLKHLDLNNNKISNIEPLSGLTKLEYLYLRNNNISNIEPLSGLTELTILYLYDNKISDIEPLSGLTELTILYLDNNNISNIKPLSGLTNLKYLDLDNNNISNIEPLSGLTKLTDLELNNNKISNIEPLSGLTKLEYLYLRNNISNIEPLSDLIMLRYLSLWGNNLSRSKIKALEKKLPGCEIFY